MNIQAITVATGDTYRGLALSLGLSMRHHGWPDLTIASDSEIKGWDGRQIVSPEISKHSLPKTAFSEFLLDEPGMVMLLDADCEAVGTFMGLDPIPEESIAGRVTGVCDAPGGIRLIFHVATLLLFGSVRLSKTIGSTWCRFAIGKHEDETPLLKATITCHKIDLGGSYDFPLPNLRHKGVVSGERHHNPA